MARDESDREDLLREATALGRRAEFRLPGEPDTVTAGLRNDGRLSIWFGSDPAYHFDAEGRLRRAFVEGRLYRTQGTTLARLTRVRMPGATEMRRHDLDPDELADFIRRMRDRLARFAAALADGQAALLRSVPADDDAFVRDLRERLAAILAAPAALAPAIRGKR
ncbi:MAG: hypothetical protein WD069_12560 [Planctomycetales bacterium]